MPIGTDSGRPTDLERSRYHAPSRVIASGRKRRREARASDRDPGGDPGFLAIDLGLVGLYLANRWWFDRWGLLNIMLDLDGEGSIANWYSVVQLALVGLMLATLAVSMTGRLDKLRVGSASLLFFFLSKEECIGFHDHLRDHMVRSAAAGRTASRFAIKTDWMVWLAPPLIIAMLLLGWRVAAILRGRGVARRFVAGMVLLVGASAGMEILLNYSVYWGMYGGLAAVVGEELGEMLGATFFLWATYDLMRSYGIELTRNGSGEATGGRGRGIAATELRDEAPPMPRRAPHRLAKAQREERRVGDQVKT